MTKVKVSALAQEFNMDTKAVVVALNDGGLDAKRSNSSVDAEAARTLLSGNSNVVGIDTARKLKTKTAKTPVDKASAAKKPGSAAERKLAVFYSKYAHVVAGSVREPTAEDRKVLSKCHGKVCTIKCVDTGVARTINTQDAFQVKRTAEAQVKYLRTRRSELRTERRAAKEAQNG